MIKNIVLYLAILIAAFVFNIFYYAWFSWVLLIIVACVPLISLVMSLPFMISCAVKGFCVFSNEELTLGDSFIVGVSSAKKEIGFCPRVKIKLKAENRFANKRKKIKILFSGSLKNPVYFKENSLAKHCGCVDISAKFCKVYDMTGIFFVPARVSCSFQTQILPKAQKPKNLPSFDEMSVLGYKPKSGGGFSDYYELRQYQKGDSLKNIHWKLSSKYDELIVREPSQPIYKQIAVNPQLCDDADKNDFVLARLYYVCKYIISKNQACYVFAKGKSSASELRNENDIKLYFNSLYNGTAYNSCVINRSNTVLLTIKENGEEVSEN